MSDAAGRTGGWRFLTSDAIAPTTRWANGAGWTTELVSRDQSRSISGRDSPAWRLSVARLESACAFSTLPGVLRTFMPVGGTVQLEIAGRVVDVPGLQTIRFPGDVPVRLLQLSQLCHAVNLMVDDEQETAGLTLQGPGTLRAAAVAVLPCPNDADGRFEAWDVTSRDVTDRRSSRVLGQVVRSTPNTLLRQGDKPTIVLGYN